MCTVLPGWSEGLVLSIVPYLLVKIILQKMMLLIRIRVVGSQWYRNLINKKSSLLYLTFSWWQQSITTIWQKVLLATPLGSIISQIWKQNVSLYVIVKNREPLTEVRLSIISEFLFSQFFQISLFNLPYFVMHEDQHLLLYPNVTSLMIKIKAF